MPDLPPPPDLPAPPDGVRPGDPAGERTGWRTAPIGFGLVLLSAPVAGWFAVWGLDHVNHCDAVRPPEEDCGLGFAVLIPLAWAFGAVVALGTAALGFVRLPRWSAWSLCAVALVLIWGANLGAMQAYRPRVP